MNRVRPVGPAGTVAPTRPRPRTAGPAHPPDRARPTARVRRTGDAHAPVRGTTCPRRVTRVRARARGSGPSRVSAPRVPAARVDPAARRHPRRAAAPGPRIRTRPGPPAHVRATPRPASVRPGRAAATRLPADVRLDLGRATSRRGARARIGRVPARAAPLGDGGARVRVTRRPASVRAGRVPVIRRPVSVRRVPARAIRLPAGGPVGRVPVRAPRVGSGPGCGRVPPPRVSARPAPATRRRVGVRRVPVARLPVGARCVHVAMPRCPVGDRFGRVRGRSRPMRARPGTGGGRERTGGLGRSVRRRVGRGRGRGRGRRRHRPRTVRMRRVPVHVRARGRVCGVSMCPAVRNGPGVCARPPVTAPRAARGTPLGPTMPALARSARPDRVRGRPGPVVPTTRTRPGGLDPHAGRGPPRGWATRASGCGSG